MKRTVCILLVLLMAALAACNSPAPEPEPPEPEYPAAQGPFVFYDLNAAMTTGGTMPMGLVGAQGDLILPCIYDRIEPLYHWDYSAPPDNLETSQRFFVAVEYANPEVEPQPDVWMENPDTAGMEDDYANPDGPVYAEEPYNPLLWMDRKALIAPWGEMVTGFDYYNIYAVAPYTRAVAQCVSDPSRYVWLDETGAESELDDPVLKARLAASNRWMFAATATGDLPTGPDIPPQGLTQVIYMPDGTYWGGHSKVLAPGQEPQGKGDYQETYRYYSAAGERLNDREYTYLELLGDNILLAYVDHHMENDTYYQDSYVTDLSGAPYTESFVSLQYYGMGPYVVGMREETAVIMRTDSFAVVKEIPVSEGTYLSMGAAGDNYYISVNSPIKPLEVHVLDTGEVISFEGLPAKEGAQLMTNGFAGFSMDACNSDMTRFVVSSSGKGVEYKVLLIDREGNTIVGGSENLYRMGTMLMSSFYNEEEGQYRSRLLDWDGNVLLGDEYSQMEVLPGNAALVVRGDKVGIVDFAGNWIYSQSVFTGLDM